MTLILAVDVETSGLMRKGLAIDDPSQPHIVEMGASLVDDDDGFEAGKLSLIVKPTDWTVEDGAAKLHGITTKRALRYGLSIRHALIGLMAMVERADEVVAHNMRFDGELIFVELHRLGASGEWWRKAHKFCTMELSTPILKLPGQFDDYKYPKLEEAHAHLCSQVKWNPTHRALDDARAALRVYRALKAPSHAG